jgi:hypothetical protein
MTGAGMTSSSSVSNIDGVNKSTFKSRIPRRVSDGAATLLHGRPSVPGRAARNPCDHMLSSPFHTRDAVPDPLRSNPTVCVACAIRQDQACSYAPALFSRQTQPCTYGPMSHRASPSLPLAAEMMHWASPSLPPVVDGTGSLGVTLCTHGQNLMISRSGDDRRMSTPIRVDSLIHLGDPFIAHAQSSVDRRAVVEDPFIEENLLQIADDNQSSVDDRRAVIMNATAHTNVSDEVKRAHRSTTVRPFSESGLLSMFSYATPTPHARRPLSEQYMNSSEFANFVCLPS